MRQRRTMSYSLVVRSLGLGLATWACLASGAWAQNFNGNNNSSVGGVSIDAAGVINNHTVEESGRLRKVWQETLHAAPADLSAHTGMRKISLRQLQAEIATHQKNKTPLPADVHFLAGLQRVQYVFVYPEQNDIVLAGPAEGWKIDEKGNVVGLTTGRPVMQLDDLLVALRQAMGETRQNIQCSIDPTQEGMANLNKYLGTLGGKIGNAKNTVASIEESLGPQTVVVRGVDDTSRFAHVLVAADYRMKRLGMGFEQAPVSGMKSFLEMSGGGNPENVFPRWWMTTNYDALLRTPAGDAWEIRGPGVKVMTEDSFFTATGERKQTGKTNPVAQKWADTMTAKYDELSVKLPIFGELRNAMDLAVVAALITQEQLAAKANCDLGVLLDTTLAVQSSTAANAVPTKATFIKKGTRYVISASGGVDLNPWTVITKSETSETLNATRTKAGTAAQATDVKAADAKVSHWWWN